MTTNITFDKLNQKKPLWKQGCRQGYLFCRRKIESIPVHKRSRRRFEGVWHFGSRLWNL